MLPDISALITSAGGVCSEAGAGILGSSSRDCAMTSNTDLASLAGSITVQADMAATLKRTGLVRGKNSWQEGTCMLAANRAAIENFSPVLQTVVR